MKDELARWVRGLGARTIEVTRVVEEEPLRAPEAQKRKTHLTAGDLPPEAIRLEINGRPFYVLLRDEEVYMAYVTRLGHVCVRGVRSRDTREAALELAWLVHSSGGKWADRNAALACNWPNVVAPPLALVELRTAAERTEGTTATLPGGAVQVNTAHSIFYVLPERNLVFIRVESWDASTFYLREVMVLTRKKRLIAIAEKQGGSVRLFRSLG